LRCPGQELLFLAPDGSLEVKRADWVVENGQRDRVTCFTCDPQRLLLGDGAESSEGEYYASEGEEDEAEESAQTREERRQFRAFWDEGASASQREENEYTSVVRSILEADALDLAAEEARRNPLRRQVRRRGGAQGGDPTLASPRSSLLCHQRDRHRCAASSATPSTSSWQTTATPTVARRVALRAARLATAS
jgi:hypothetical protein